MAYPVKVGQRDSAYDPGDLQCFVSLPQIAYSYICTLPKAHHGPHVAHDSIGRVLQIHSDIPEEMQVDEGL